MQLHAHGVYVIGWESCVENLKKQTRDMHPVGDVETCLDLSRDLGNFLPALSIQINMWFTDPILVDGSANGQRLVVNGPSLSIVNDLVVWLMDP